MADITPRNRLQSRQAQLRRTLSLNAKLTTTQIVLATILAVGLVLVINFTARILADQELQRVHNRITTEIAALETEQENLLEQLAFVTSDAYVHEWARSEGKMALPNDVLVIPIPEGVPEEESLASNIPVTGIVTTNPRPEPWQIWGALFFDTPIEQTETPP